MAIEASGAYPALQEAVRCCAVGGRVVPLAFYEGEACGLRLGEEWHINRVTVLSSRACTEPDRDYPLWDNRRVRETAFSLLREGRLRADGISILSCPSRHPPTPTERLMSVPGKACSWELSTDELGEP